MFGFIAGLLTAAAIVAFWAGQRWYRDQQLERSISEERYRIIEAQMAALRTMITTQGRLIGNLSAAGGWMDRSQQDAPPWFS